MANSSLSLLQHRMKQRNVSGAISPQAAILCEIIDEFNDQHWQDRNRYHERIKVLEADNEKLKADLVKLVKASEQV